MEKQNYIIENNLTFAWGKALSLFDDKSGTEIQPLFLTVKIDEKGTIIEDTELHKAIDEFLDKKGKYSCQTVANTIFPKSLWNPKKNRKTLFDRYNRVHSIIMKSDVRNKKGRYFDRLIRYDDNNHNGKLVNQLEYIISTRMDKNNHRRSAYQASIINPYTDHTHQPISGFPCLQQISFIPNSQKGTLSVFGYYPYQYIIDRAYGNYLGLCWLGQFMAHEMGLEFSEMTCVTGIAKLGDKINKTDADLKKLKDMISERMKAYEEYQGK